MTNEVLLKFLLDQLRALIKETKEINQKNKNTNEQYELIEDQMSDEELECLQEQFEMADQYDPEEDFSHALDDLAVSSESNFGETNNNNATSFLPESAPGSAVTMSPQDLVLVCSAFAPTSTNDFAIGYNQCFRVDTLTLLSEFAQHVTTQSLENNTGYKQWKPGLRSA